MATIGRRKTRYERRSSHTYDAHVRTDDGRITLIFGMDEQQSRKGHIGLSLPRLFPVFFLGIITHYYYYFYLYYYYCWTPHHDWLTTKVSRRWYSWGCRRSIPVLWSHCTCLPPSKMTSHRTCAHARTCILLCAHRLSAFTTDIMRVSDLSSSFRLSSSTSVAWLEWLRFFSPRRSPFALCAALHSVRPCEPRSL